MPEGKNRARCDAGYRVALSVLALQWVATQYLGERDDSAERAGYKTQSPADSPHSANNEDSGTGGRQRKRVSACASGLRALQAWELNLSP